MRNYSTKFLFLIVALLAQTSIYAQQTDALKSLYDRRQYFDLRDAVAAKKSKEKSAEMIFYRGVVANRFNDTEESIRLLREFIDRADASDARLPDAYEVLADSYTKNYEYGRAADAYKLLAEKYKDRLGSERIKNFENVFGLWDALRAAPRQTISFDGDSNIQGTRDKAKLLNLNVEIGNQKMDFVFDTGANISTVSTTTAQKLGLKIIEAEVAVGSSTDKKVKSKLAVAPQMKIGNATVRHAVFLVFDDSALFFLSINYQINGIIGFPVIEAFGKISTTRDDRILIEAKTDKTASEPNMCLDGLMPMVAATYKNRRMIFAFDTGATATDFYPAFFKENEAEITKNSAAQKMRVGGAGGFFEVDGYTIKDLNLTVGGKTARLAEARVLPVQTNEGSRYFYGNIGQDLIKQFTRMTLDFRLMRISFE